MEYPQDIEVLADEWEEKQQVLKELAMYEIECSQCGHDDHEKVPGYKNLVECYNCGNIWEAFIQPHGISEQDWEYADYMHDKSREG